MPKAISSPEIDAMAEEILGASQLAAIARARRSSAGETLTEPEFLALEALIKSGSTMTVGEIQRTVGVLPAQMSRILRGLERHTSGKPLVTCSINSDDRRRVDVSLTDAGREVYNAYRRMRLSFLCDFLDNLTPDDRVVFMRIVRDFAARIKAVVLP
ncbi:MAG: hypothetical protein FLDDKLPJ_02767 [Phycisphaerae bacterium]|nr:hypothetical protein [Phycisphaerae bacterium]